MSVHEGLTDQDTRMSSLLLLLLFSSAFGLCSKVMASDL